MNMHANKKGKADSRLIIKSVPPETPFRIWGRNKVTPIVPKACKSQNKLNSHTLPSEKMAYQAAFFFAAVFDSLAIVSDSHFFCSASSQPALRILSGRYFSTI